MPQAPPSTTAPAYTTRLLPPEEWSRLQGLPIAVNLPDPAFSLVLVSETPSGEIVAVWAAITTVHLEGAWVHPDHRGGPLASRMITAMKQTLREHGIWQALTVVTDPAVMVIAHKAGFVRGPGDLWVLRLTPDDPPGTGD